MNLELLNNLDRNLERRAALLLIADLAQDLVSEDLELVKAAMRDITFFAHTFTELQTISEQPLIGLQAIEFENKVGELLGRELDNNDW